jgi:hypothetical protein
MTSKIGIVATVAVAAAIAAAGIRLATSGGTTSVGAAVPAPTPATATGSVISAVARGDLTPAHAYEDDTPVVAMAFSRASSATRSADPPRAR